MGCGDAVAMCDEGAMIVAMIGVSRMLDLGLNVAGSSVEPCLPAEDRVDGLAAARCSCDAREQPKDAAIESRAPMLGIAPVSAAHWWPCVLAEAVKGFSVTVL